MNARHSTATPVNEYQPTIIESGLLLHRLAIEIGFFKAELKRAWADFKHDPAQFTTNTIRDLARRVRGLAHALPATSIALVLVTLVIAVALLVDRKKADSATSTADEENSEVVMLDPAKQPDTKTKPDSSIGKDGKGRVGFNSGTGEGSGPTPKMARGGGGSGDHNPVPSQTGKIPPPSPVLAAITPPPPAPSLPVAGIDIDPVLWKDLKAPVYGDPRSNSEVPSKGPGEGGLIGTNKGLGIGPGNGIGYGPGNHRNMGGGDPQDGCCGPGGGDGDNANRTYNGSEVEQRARLLSKPEPQYTEEARRNQISGTVTLRVVFSSGGDVVQIRAMRTLPFGLTERAIAAARLIKFVPAVKGGHAVSVHMQLEYNFNLY